MVFNINDLLNDEPLPNNVRTILERFPETHVLENKTSFRRRLLKWFDNNQRELPWRQNKTPYRIWVSEIMLQQTQVVKVVDYYCRFIERFPTVAELAAAQIDDVLKLWEGLGYYRRARQMHAAAQIIATQHDGDFPDDFASVLALPGIGRYTAGAILSISLDQQHPILEGNTFRLFSRLMLVRDDPRSTENQRHLWSLAKEILPRRRAGDFNQALMELGATVCSPTNPQCTECPLRSLCPTNIRGLQGEIPVPARKMKFEDVTEAMVLVERNGKYLVRKCRSNERWAGMWDFPRYAVGKTNGKNTPEAQIASLAEKLQSDYGLEVELESLDHSVKHAVTRFRITLNCFASKSVRGRLKSGARQTVWASQSEIGELPMSVTGRMMAKKLI